MVLEVEGLDPRLCRLGFVEVLIDDSRLRLAEPDEVDYVRKDLDEAVMSRLEEVIEGEICDAALDIYQQM